MKFGMLFKPFENNGKVSGVFEERRKGQATRMALFDDYRSAPISVFSITQRLS